MSTDFEETFARMRDIALQTKKREADGRPVKVIRYCRRGHARTPENLNNSGACKACAVEVSRKRKVGLYTVRATFTVEIRATCREDAIDHVTELTKSPYLSDWKGFKKPRGREQR